MLAAALLLFTVHRASGARTILQDSGPGVNWQYGVCPLVVKDADFSGNDLSHDSQPDVSSCCARCSDSLQAWKAKHTSPDAKPGSGDRVCLAWTYAPSDQQCYLKTGTMKGSSTTLMASAGTLTGSYEGNVTALQAQFDTFVKDKLTVIQRISAAMASATATPGQNTMVEDTCVSNNPSCQKILATIK